MGILAVGKTRRESRQDGRNVKEFKPVDGDCVISRAPPSPCLSGAARAKSLDSRRGPQA